MIGVGLGVRFAEFDATSTAGPSFASPENSEGVSFLATSGGELGFDWDEALYTGSLFGSLLYERFYASLNVEMPLRTEDTDLHTTLISNPGPGFGADGSYERDSKLDRIDVTITLGTKVRGGLSLFTGFKYTEFELESREFNFLLDNKNQKYLEEGIFVGASYLWSFGSRGNLTASIAYAYLNSEFSESNITVEPPPFGLSLGEFSFDGTATGLSYGLQWSGRLSGNWLYNASIKRQSYASDNSATKLEAFAGDFLVTQNPEVPLPVTISPTAVTDIDTKHTDTNFSIGIFYLF